jgi:hypothetical protein
MTPTKCVRQRLLCELCCRLEHFLCGVARWHRNLTASESYCPRTDKGTAQSTGTTSLQARADFGISRQDQKGELKDVDMDKCTPEDVGDAFNMIFAV